MNLTLRNKEVTSRAYAAVSLTPKEESALVRLPGGRTALEVGIGKTGELTRRRYMTALRKVIVLAKANRLKRLILRLKDFSLAHLTLPEEEILELIAVNFEMANFEFVKYKNRRPRDGTFSMRSRL